MLLKLGGPLEKAASALRNRGDRELAEDAALDSAVMSAAQLPSSYSRLA